MKRDVIIRLAISMQLGALAQPPIAHAQFVCGSERDSAVVTEAYPCGIDSIIYQPIRPFIRHRPGEVGQDIRFRDLEFFWHDEGGYGAVPVGDLRSTLERFGSTLCDSTGRNPLGVPVWDFHLVYNYFRRSPTPYNSSNARDSTSVVIGREDKSGLHVYDDYNNADRSHVDAYLINPDTIGTDGGHYPSGWMAADEDVSTGYGADPCQVRHGNSLDLKGPPASGRIDLDGTGWTRPNTVQNTGFNHEFQHGLPGAGSEMLSELMSAGAEAVGGMPPVLATGEFPYTWSLMAARGGEPSCTNLRTSDSNYHARTAFMAYLTYNFRGADTSSTISGIEDDLLRRWIGSGTNSLSGLRSQLGNMSSPEFAGLRYFKDANGDPLSDADRLALLLHNWRVANYVNNSMLEEGQYGFRPSAGFSPANQLLAWQEIDGCASDDIVAVPAEVVIQRAQVSRETTFVRERAYHGSTFPMTLQMFGSEYWVVRADPASYSSGQDLIVRVSPTGIHRSESVRGVGAFDPCPEPPYELVRSARLLVSLVTYSIPAGQEAAPLWQHPEWSRLAVAPRWVDVDSLVGDLEFVVSSFGDSVKAVVVVLSLGDGPGSPNGGYTGTSGLAYAELLPYRLSASLRRGATDGPAPVGEIASSSTRDEHPAWSPAGDSLLFVRTSGVSAPKLHRKRVGVAGSQAVIAGAPLGERQLQPAWSPRGDYAAFTRLAAGADDYEVWVYNLRAGTDLRRLVTRDGAETSPAFQPNGQRIAYLTTLMSGDTINEIRRIRLDGVGDTLLYQRRGLHSIRSLRWSPDGRWIYFLANDSLYALGVDFPMRGQVVARPGIVPSCTSFDLPIGPGRTVAAQTGSLPYELRCRQLRCNGPCGGGSSLVGTLQMPFQRIVLADTVHSDTLSRFYVTGAEFSDPRWSPDGTRLAYVSNQNLVTDRDIFIGRPSFNHAPFLHDVAQFYEADVYAHVPFSYDFSATDPDGEPVTFQAVYLPDSATFHPTTGLFSWPNPKKAGADSLYFVVFRALDPSGGVHSYVARFRVMPQAPGGGGCPFVDVATADGWITDNSILGRSRTGEPGLDAYRLKHVPAVRDGRVRLRLRENEQELTTLDQVRLIAVDRAPGLTLLTSGGELHWGERVPAWRVTTARGEDLTSLVSGAPGSMGWQGAPGDTVLVQMTDPGGGRYGLTGTQDGGGGTGEGDEKYVELRYDPTAGGGRYAASEAGATAAGIDARWLDETGIRVQVPDGLGGWQDLAHWYPRENRDGTYFPALTHDTVRLIFVGRHRLTFFGRLKPKSGAVTQAVLEPLMARHTRLGDARGAVGGGAEATELVPGDSLYLEFAVPAVAAGMEREYVLVTRGVYTANVGAARLQPQGPRVPVRFALLQNVPNPFAGTTTIGFELPRAERVKLEVFDLLGRRVRTLAEGEWPAGYHAVEWDRSGEGGARLRAGVYLYRLTAGAFRDQKKMVIGAR